MIQLNAAVRTSSTAMRSMPAETLFRVDPERNMKRFYKDLQPFCRTFRVLRAQFVLFLELYPQAKEQNLYTRWLLRSGAYPAARLFRASARS